jgi:hypothetical protein
MRGIRAHVRRIGFAILVVVFVAPLLVGAHVHADAPTATCAKCVTGAQSAATAPDAATDVSPIIHATAAVIPPPGRPSRGERPQVRGRAPPASFLAVGS